MRAGQDTRTMILRDHLFRLLTCLLAIALLPIARSRHAACQWALAARFPAEDLTGLPPATRAAFTAARTEALWRDGVLIGLTSGYRDAGTQQRMFAADTDAGGLRVLPPSAPRGGGGPRLAARGAGGARWPGPAPARPPPSPGCTKGGGAPRPPAPKGPRRD